MKKYVFEVKEVSKGVAVVYAENEDDALDMVYSYEGDLLIHNSEIEVGGLVEVTDAEDDDDEE